MSLIIVIIGAGPGGYVAAIEAAMHGADVTLVEKHALGGTCLNWGCIPSKIMKTWSDNYLKVQTADRFGIRIDGTIQLDMAAFHNQKNKIIASQQQGIASLLNSCGVKVVEGTATILSDKEVQVISPENAEQKIEYDKLIIATGTKPLELKNLPFDHQSIVSSDDLLSLEKLPESIVIVGGGVIGCEFACMLSQLGVDVTVVEGMSRLLPMASMDMECSKLLAREMKKQKVRVLCDTIVRGIEDSKEGLQIQLDVSGFTDNPKPKKLKATFINAQKVAVCVGREPVTNGLNLEGAGIQTDKNGWIKVAEQMETSVKGIYAIGDITGPEKIMLAHVASAEAKIAAQNAMGHLCAMDYTVIPNAIFTTPEIGSVGLSQEEANGMGINFETFSVNFRNLGKAHAIGQISGMAKIIVETESKKLLGAHIIGARATDLIAQAALAIQNDLTIKAIATTIHAHPTLSEIMCEVCLKADGRPVHG